MEMIEKHEIILMFHIWTNKESARLNLAILNRENFTANGIYPRLVVAQGDSC